MRPELANSPCSRLPKQKSSAHLPNLSREARLWTTVVDELPSGHSKGGGFSSAALEGSAALPWAPSPEPCKGRRPKNRQSQRRKVFLSGFPAFSLPACLCQGFPGFGSLVLRPCPFGFLFGFCPLLVSFLWPWASRSSSQREGRRVKLRGTDPRTGLFRYPPSLGTF